MEWSCARAASEYTRHRSRSCRIKQSPNLDLSEDNLPPGTQLALGTAVIEVTSQPHTGCGKFVERFGADAMHFVNSPTGRSLRMRGLNAKVVRAGRIRPGDLVRKIISEES